MVRRILQVAALVAGLACLAWLARSPGSVPGAMPTPGRAAVTLPGGLVIEDVRPGTGGVPEKRTLVTVHYTVWTSDGRQVLSTWESGQPLSFTFGTGQAVPGFEEALSTMREGGRRRAWLTAEQGYGVSGAPGVAPNTRLVFEMELLPSATEEGPFPEDRNL